MRFVVGALLGLGLVVAGGCGGGEPREFAAFPLDEIGEIVEPADEGIRIDREVSADGRGSLCVEARAPRVVRLFDVPVGELAGREITCTARMKSLVMRGWAYPELWAHVTGRDDLSARDPQGGIARTQDWKDVRVSLRLEKGQQPDRVRVNLAIEGAGRVWIDDVRLSAGRPRPAQDDGP